MRLSVNIYRFIIIILIVLMNTSSAQQKNISPGGLIAYDLENDLIMPPHQIYTINADGTGNTKLISSSLGLNHLEYSHDGTNIMLVGYMDATNSTWSIHKFDLESKTLTRLTKISNVWDTDPSWSPNDSTIAYTRIYQSQNMKNETWIMQADGTNQHYIGVPGFQPKWSPDGKRIIYSANPAGNWQIYSCNVDGSGVLRLTNNSYDDMSPKYSPDGKKILFTSSRDGNSELYVMNADGTQQMRLTNNAAYDANPKWSSDGAKIVFESDRNRAQYKCDLYIINADGTNLQQITNFGNTQQSAICPDWKPGTATSVKDGTSINIPEEFKLHQNYPNPFNPSTEIRYELYKTSHVKLEISDLSGKIIKVLSDEILKSGSHTTYWNGADKFGNIVSSGIYFIRLQTEHHTMTCKAILLK